jgi:hypothetical protein
MHDELEKETIRSSIHRHQLRILPGQIRDEIMGTCALMVVWLRLKIVMTITASKLTLMATCLSPVLYHGCGVDQFFQTLTRLASS